MQPIRVFHIPYLMPYTRKIVSDQIQAVNAYERYSERSIYIKRLFSPEELDTFDVLHLHSLRWGTIQELRALFEQCAANHKRIVFTAHDLWSLRDDEELYRARLSVACELADAVITLTQRSAEKLTQLVEGIDVRRKLSVIPHGFAVHPRHPRWGLSGSQKPAVQYALYGQFRHNRDLLGFAQLWQKALQGTEAQLNVLLSIPDLSLVNDPQLHVKETLAFLRADQQQMRLIVTSFLSDEQIIQSLLRNDVLALPYKWGTHSGQLEMAFDLNLVPLAPRVGFFAEQWKCVQAYVPEPCWFEWPAPSAGTAHCLEYLREAQSRLCQDVPRVPDKHWRSYRLWEHEQFLQAHYQLYCGASVVTLAKPEQAQLETLLQNKSYHFSSERNDVVQYPSPAEREGAGLSKTIRPKMRSDTFCTPVANGVLFRNQQKSLELKGRVVYRWVERLGPYLNGGYTLEEITRGLNSERQNWVTDLIELLLKEQFLKDASLDHPHTLSRLEEETYAPALAYISCFQNSEAYRFERFRQCRVLIIGSGLTCTALVSALLHRGVRQLAVLTTAERETDTRRYQEYLDMLHEGDPYQALEVLTFSEWQNEAALHALLEPYDAVLHVSDRPMLARALLLNRLCLAQQKKFLQAVLIDTQAWIGPLVDGECQSCWECAWRQLQAQHSNSDGSYTFQDHAADPPHHFVAWPTASMLANLLSFELFKDVTGAGPQELKGHVMLIDLADARGQFLVCGPHPLCRACSSGHMLDASAQ